MATSDIVAFDAFRFLYVRGPKPNTPSETSFVLQRKDLPFAETAFEANLKAIRSATDYLAALTTVADSVASAPEPADPGGIFLSVDALTSLLADTPHASPDALHQLLRDSYSNLRSQARDAEFLTIPLANAWDAYLGELLQIMTGRQRLSHRLDRLTTILRLGAAIGAAIDLTKPGGSLSELLQASIHVPGDLIDTTALRRLALARLERPIVSGAIDQGREHQNDLVRAIVQSDLAVDELTSAVLNGHSEPDSPGSQASTSTGGNESLDSVAAPQLTVRIDTSIVSAATRDLLVSRFGAAVNGDKIDGVPIARTLATLGHDLEHKGTQLFGDAPMGETKQITTQLWALRDELKRTGTISPTALAQLPLLSPFVETGAVGRPSVSADSSVRSLGVGDLKVVKQTLFKYQPGELAYIENILDGQAKERIHSVKQKTEETITLEEATSTTSEKDLQSTDRFEVADETSTAFSEKQQNEFGVNVSASYGPVSVSAHTESTSEATQQANRKHSQAFVKEIVSKSVEKIQQTVRQERTRKTTLEIEETSKYALSAKGKSVVGMYRWVDKVYWAQINVYGKRLMFEFMVPEPQAVYLHTEATKPTVNARYAKPDPLTITPGQITRYNYLSLAAKYAAEVETPPPLYQQSQYVWLTSADQQKVATVKMTEGFVGAYAAPAASWNYTSGTSPSLTVMIGTAMWKSGQAWRWEALGPNSVADVPLQVTSLYVTYFAVTGSVLSLPSEALFERWQLETYKALLSAYRLREAEYEEYENSRREPERSLRVKSDAESRAIERRELTRACLSILTLQHFGGFGAITPNPTTGWPEIDFDAAQQQGQQAAFFQQSFEWEQLTYVFYPYFWGRQSQWATNLTVQAGDSLFGKFLSSGFARVVAPVRPGHEADILYFMETGQIWSGGDPPVLNDPRYVDIVNEIKESLDAPDGGVPDGSAPWQFTVPTSLVVLDDSGILPEWPKPRPVKGAFKPSTELCDGVPYNAAQWKDAKTIAEAIKELGYELVRDSDPAKSLEKSQSSIRAMQTRFNQLGVSALIGRQLVVNGRADACTLRSLTYFDALRAANEWPGP